MAVTALLFSAPAQGQTLGPLPATNLPGYSYVIGKSAVAVSVTGTTNETTLATITIPAGAIGPNGQVEMWIVYSTTNNANAKTPRIKLGATAYYAPAITTATTVQAFVRIANRNSASSQVGMAASSPVGVGMAVGSAITTSAINTATAQDITITGQLGVGTDTMTLESYSVRIIYGA